MSDISIAVKYKEGIISDNFRDLLKETMGYRTAQVPKADVIANSFSPFSFLDVVANRDSMALINLRDADGQQVFSEADAQAIITRFTEEGSMYRIENVVFDDRPEIKVAKEVENGRGNKQWVTKDFSELSLGQQQAILLSVLLYSDNNCPLIIDQPEDNLDSEFIYHTLVKSLRRIKEKRQVIIVTHNANIAVLGDAELIIPLKSTGDRSRIMDRGSIDTKKTKDIACRILEGSEYAFKKRKHMYGID